MRIKKDNIDNPEIKEEIAAVAAEEEPVAVNEEAIVEEDNSPIAITGTRLKLQTVISSIIAFRLPPLELMKILIGFLLE